MESAGFLALPEETEDVRKLYDDDIADPGFVMNTSRLWAYQPDTVVTLSQLMGQAFSQTWLSLRQRGILVAACASAIRDSYCSLAWGTKLAAVADPSLAAGVLSGDDSQLTNQEKAIAAWARAVARDANATTADDVQRLRDAGLDDDQIFAITAFVALRTAFSTVNDALGAQPDSQYTERAPAEVLQAVTFGRHIEERSG